MPKIVLNLRDGINIKEAPGGGAEFHSETGVWLLKEASPGAVEALVRLASGGATKEELEQTADEADWFFSNFSHYYEKLSGQGFITWSLEENGQKVARLEVIAPGFELCLPEVDPMMRFILSRFAYSRSLNNKTVIETPLKPVRLVLEGWLGAALWGLLSRPCGLAEISALVPGADPDTVRLLLQLFHAAGVIREETADGGAPEDQDQVLRQWEFHDLLFHSRIRDGRHDYPMGAAYCFWPEIQPLPACKPTLPGEIIELCRPDLERLKEEDHPFTRVLEERRSVRDYDPEAITLQQLGEFLYRAARVKEVLPADPEHEHLYEASLRLYPGGGACHGLEIYLTVGECRGLKPGLYYYDPFGHRLTRLCGENRYTRLILSHAENSTGRLCRPQVVINITARFQRLSWKYRCIAYSLILKDVGGLYQTMYLVAAAMGLAPCALGAGHADWLCRAAGLNYLEESPVGEFLLGSKRKGA